jgi:acyl-coenzyme A thioesterase 9
MKLIGYDYSWGKSNVDKSLLAKHLKQNQNELTKQRMKDSYAEALIPLADDPELRNRYANFQKLVRFGRLLEDLDTMAGEHLFFFLFIFGFIYFCASAF